MDTILTVQANVIYAMILIVCHALQNMSANLALLNSI